MRFRRISIALAVSSMLFAAVGCGSSDNAGNTTPTSESELGRLAIPNTLNPCWLANESIDAWRAAKKPKGTPLQTGKIIFPIEEDGERRCDYDSGELIISTYSETPGYDKLYKELLLRRENDNNMHAVGGDLAKKAAGMWFTFNGTLRGGMMQPKDSGVTIVIQTTADSIWTRKKLNSIATLATNDVLRHYDIDK